MVLIPKSYGGKHHFIMLQSNDCSPIKWILQLHQLQLDGYHLHEYRGSKWVSFDTVEEAIEFRLTYEG